jgi:membrane associated rhomboid family serine protease
MLPIQDLNPTRRLPLFTWALILINVLAFIWEMSLTPEELTRTIMDISVVPARLNAEPFTLEALQDAVRSMFLHGGYDHILGNMLYLYLFGDNLEDRLTPPVFLFIYFVSGFIAIAAQVLIDPTSTVPLIGASGAIAGVLGGYLILFPTVKVRGIIFLGYIGRIAELPAVLVLGFWFVLQVINGVASLGEFQYGGGVAFFAHIGGFIGGMILTALAASLVGKRRGADSPIRFDDIRGNRFR